MAYKIEKIDILEFCKNYQGELFHALLTDAPYHLQSIVDRFGKEGSAPAKHGKDGIFQRTSKGFMNQVWDGGDIAFKPETWEAIKKLLYPGAFCMAYGGSRGFHRMACAIEDAGFIIHPTVVWLQGQGFPKATRVDTQIEDEGLSKSWEGHRYGSQALKPSAEFMVMFQKSYKGKPIDCMTETGAGAININNGRISNGEQPGFRSMSGFNSGGKSIVFGDSKGVKNTMYNQGRWPANAVLSHHPECKIIGRCKVEGYKINQWKDNAHPFGNGAGNEYESQEVEGGYEDVYECVDGCPVKELGDSSRYFYNSDHVLEKLENENPFFYYPKVSRSEREAGCEDLPEVKNFSSDEDASGVVNPVRNNHPSLKPISLNKHLSGLLLPPDLYSPRRILVPFSGAGSEMIGALLAGWEEIVGVEFIDKYCEIAQNRLDFWNKYCQNGITNPEFIINAGKNRARERSLF